MGETCATAVKTDYCQGVTCQNGGLCRNVDSGSTKYVCDCASGFIGSLCETKINPCDAAPCKNGGTCAPAVGTAFTCACTDSFIGERCETANPCAMVGGQSGPCQNGGSCSLRADDASKTVCACSPGFTGEKCETKLDSQDCKTPLPFTPWKLNVVALGSVGTSQSPYQSDFQGPLAALGDVHVRDFATNWVAVSGRSGVKPKALYAGGDVEYIGGSVENGALEAGGDVYLQSATVNGDVQAGGDLLGTAAGGSIKGTVQLGGSNKAPSQLTTGAVTAAVGSLASTLNLPQLGNYFRSLSTQAGLQAPDLKYDNSWDKITIAVPSGGVHYAEIPAAELKQAHSITISGPAAAVVIINVPGDAAELDSLTWKWEGGISQDRVIVNYPHARTLQLSSGDHRTALLAPFADVTFSSGLVTGHLVVNNLLGGGQVNDDFQFTGGDLISNLADRCFTGNADACQTNPCQNGGTCATVLGGFQCTCATGFAGLRCTVSTTVTFTAKAGAGSSPYWARVDISPGEKVDSATLVQGTFEYKLVKQHWDVPVFTLTPDRPLKDNEQVIIRVTDIYGKQHSLPIVWLGGSSCGDNVCAADETNANCAKDCPLTDKVVDTAKSTATVANYDAGKFAQALADSLPSVNAYQVQATVVNTQTTTANMKMRILQAATSPRTTSTTTIDWWISGVNQNHAATLVSTANTQLQTNEALISSTGVTSTGGAAPTGPPTTTNGNGSGAASSGSGSKAWVAGIVIPLVVLVAVAAFVIYRRKVAAPTPSPSNAGAPATDYELMDKHL